MPHREHRWGTSGPPWVQGARRWHAQRRFLFVRFALTFGVFALLLLSGMAVLAFLVNRAFGNPDSTAVFVWVGGCGLALLLPLAAVAVAMRGYRRFATPLADLMDAADAVRRGDLSARVPIHGGPFTRLAESFNRMTQELQRADRQRRDLTADVAHELRTPLHVIQGNLEGILDGVYEPTEGHIAATLAETRSLARLVDDLRTLSLAESGQLPLEHEPVDIAELLQDMATSFGGQAEVAQVALRIQVDGQADALRVTGDAGRLGQVLGNLLANALRHTPPGGSIELYAGPLPDGEGVRMTVADTGAGIAAEDLPHIFDRFWRADKSRSHAQGAGSGLGLAIARQLVQAHGGRITAASQPGQGSVFTIDLPATLPPES